MQRSSLPRVETLVETAQIPENPSNLFKEFGQTDVYRAIISYYRNHTDVQPSAYCVSNDESSHKTDTTLYVPDGEVNISNLVDMNVNYSNYSYHGLEEAGIEIDKVWNGESSIIVYNDDQIEFGKTDYYTSRIFSRLLYVEAAKALADNNGEYDELKAEEFPLRNSMLRTEAQFFDTESFSTGGASGGVIVGKRDGDWKILLGKRSEKPRVNQGLVSIAPNGGVEYEDLQDGGFEVTMKREFSEEVTPNKDGFFDEHVEYEHVTTGWNMRGGTIAVGYALFVDEQGYEEIYNSDTTNFEFSSLVEIDVGNYEDVTETVQLGNMSPSTIPTVLETLKLFDAKDSLPDLPYEIEKQD